MDNLYLKKLEKMSDDAIKIECERHGYVMEKGYMSPAEKIRAFLCFSNAVKRPAFESEKETLLTAIRVLRIL